MTKKIIESCIAGFSALILLTNFTFADEITRNTSLDRMTYTVNPSIELIGPVFRDQSDKSEKTKYVNSLAALILKEADSIARKYLEAGDTEAYYSFLVLSLTVPLHEGFFVQFRNVDGDVCNIKANNAELIRKSGNTNYMLFNQYFKNSIRPYFPNCEVMNKTVGVNQIIRGGDGTDLSIMQVSIRWHFDDFLAYRKYESVSQTLNYGFNLLLTGFDAVYRNVENYECILQSDFNTKKKKINYKNLIKGIWAGKYNSGSITETCRITDQNSPYKNHDILFAKNLDQILNFKGLITPSYIGELKVEGDTSDAIYEIINNFKNNKNERLALSKIIDFQ